MRKDKKKNTEKVLAAAIKNPLASQRELAKVTGVSKSAVGRAEKELGQSGAIEKTEKIASICDKDIEIVEGAQELSNIWIKNTTEEAKQGAKPTREDAFTASRIGAESQKRYSILGGNNTDEEGKDKVINIISYADTINADTA